MRLFLAIELSQEVKDRIEELQSELRTRLSSARCESSLDDGGAQSRAGDDLRARVR